MKHRLQIFAVLAVILIMTFAGCGTNNPTPGGTDTENSTTSAPTQETAMDYEKAYDTVLDGFYSRILTGQTDSELISCGENGITEAEPGKTAEEVLDSVGYAIRDLSGDGIPELIVGSITEQNADKRYGTDIYAVYTYAEGNPVFVFDGSSRNRYSLLAENHFYHSGSAGAGVSLFGEYRLSEDGRTLICTDFYFTAAKDDGFTEIGYYRNNSGKTEPSASEELSLTESEFWAIEEGLTDGIQKLELTPFSACKDTDKETDPDREIRVQVMWAKDIGQSVSNYDQYTPDTTELQDMMVFTSDSPVKDFKVLALSIADVDDDGNIRFTVTELYHHGTLSPEKPLAAGITVAGSIPNYGVSYEDDEGNTRRFAIEISGEDGSLYLTEF